MAVGAVIVKPATVLRWHRNGYRRYWRWKSQGEPGRPRIPRRHIEFVRRISSENPSWGEDRIALEMRLKLGVEHSTSTIRRYMVDLGPAESSTWKQFLASHAKGILCIDFATQPSRRLSLRYVLIVLALDSRRIVHVGVTASPTLDWVKRQLCEATAWGETPRFLLHDDDGIFGQYRCGSRKPGSARSYRCALDRWLDETLEVKGIPIPYGAPNAAAHVERLIGSLRRECLAHFLFASEGHLRRTVREYAAWHNGARVHQGIDDIPDVRAGRSPARRPPAADVGRRVGHPVLGAPHRPAIPAPGRGRRPQGPEVRLRRGVPSGGSGHRRPADDVSTEHGEQGKASMVGCAAFVAAYIAASILFLIALTGALRGSPPYGDSPE